MKTTRYEVETNGQEVTEVLPGQIDSTDPTHFTLTTTQSQAAEIAMNGDPAIIRYTEITEAVETPETPFCRGGQHHVEAGKTVNAKGWCNLCLKDVQRGKAAGTTARERGLK